MELLDTVCQITGARRARRLQRIQSLWRGYGEVVRVGLHGAEVERVVVKHVRPPRDAHPRKLRSYRVEAAFYEHFAPWCDAGCRVPRWWGARSAAGSTVFVLEDLDHAGYTGRRSDLDATEQRACLRWLAHFHGAFLGVRPRHLWKVGTYWHLATRPDELERMRDTQLRARAHDLDRQLNTAGFQTLVHGDAKPANFCFAPDGGVAAVDFQYVGGGVGIKDVVYLLAAWRHISASALEQALQTYFHALRDAVPEHVDATAVEREWRGLVEPARLDFARFLDGWR